MPSSSASVMSIALVSFLGTISCLQWETGPGPVVHSCKGRQVTFPWGYQTDPEEEVVDIHWVFQGIFFELPLASFTHDVFLPNPDYSPRLRHLPDGGLSLRDVTEADSGNYTIEVNVLDRTGSYVSYRQSAYLQVGDGLMIEDKELRVQQDPRALWDEAAGQWVIRLTCGRLTFLGQSPAHVVWTTPSGETKPSTDDENGNFYLTLPSPVLGGNYSCHIPTHLLSDVCATETHLGDDTLKSIVHVDEFKARMSLIEAELATVKKENREVKSNVHGDEFKARMSLIEAELATVKKENRELKEDKKRISEDLRMVQQQYREEMANLTQYVDGQKTDLTRYVDAQDAGLMQKIKRAEDTHRSDNLSVHSLLTHQQTQLSRLISDAANERVSFHATGMKDDTPDSGDTLVLHQVKNNQGNAYNPSTGVFTAPHNGTYCFIASTGADGGSSHNDQMELVVDGVRVDFVRMREAGSQQSGSVQAVLRLTTGNRVYLRSYGSGNDFYATSTAFSGFLVNLDP